MIVLKVTELGYIPNDEHTVGYAKKIANWICNGVPPDDSDNIFTCATDGIFQHAAGQDFFHANAMMRKQISEYISSINFLDADLNDFYYREAHTEIEEGLFWLPNATHCRRYRVSDGKEL